MSCLRPCVPVTRADVCCVPAGMCTALTRLPCCPQELSGGVWEPGSFHVLTSLLRLRRLSLGPTSHLPACLPQLSGLSELAMREAGKAMLPEAACAAVDAALHQLTQVQPWKRLVLSWLPTGWAAHLQGCICAGKPAGMLPRCKEQQQHQQQRCCMRLTHPPAANPLRSPQLTSLCIDDAPDRCGPFAALAALNRLQRCCLGNAERGFRQQQDPPLQLPTGPWAGSLRSLGAGWDVLPHSSQLLSAATQLTELAVTGGSLEAPLCPQFWRWAETHRSLQRLQIDVWGSLPAWMVQYMLGLKDARPGLDIQVEQAFDDGMFSEQWRVWV